MLCIPSGRSAGPGVGARSAAGARQLRGTGCLGSPPASALYRGASGWSHLLAQWARFPDSLPQFSWRRTSLRPPAPAQTGALTTGDLCTTFEQAPPLLLSPGAVSSETGGCYQALRSSCDCCVDSSSSRSAESSDSKSNALADQSTHLARAGHPAGSQGTLPPQALRAEGYSGVRQLALQSPALMMALALIKLLRVILKQARG
ncbi:unnamed protein product [Rangifer tarandus platyrhynchus]|uniref:Uncharacterized protein n=1 Tax=Rangifer tarandus platyrhynchus TaxID=3082113 RepID=A0ABN8YYJ0_RANTA|nr:unnamed protein product [Rangifer tarandus platyrhynchus]